MPGVTWNFEAEYIQSCNCDYGCPCNFNALPTTGTCEALVAWRIRKGAFNGTKLDGVKFAWGLHWPGPIHLGNGMARLYIDPSAGPAQRLAIEEITAGKHEGGVFEVFPKTFSKVYPTQLAKIDFKYDGYTSGFTVEGVGEVKSTNIRNPVTGAKFSGEIFLPGGINFKRAFVTSIERWSLQDGEFQMEHKNKAGFASVTTYTNKGPLRSDPNGRSKSPRRGTSKRRARRRAR